MTNTTKTLLLITLFLLTLFSCKTIKYSASELSLMTEIKNCGKLSINDSEGKKITIPKATLDSLSTTSKEAVNSLLSSMDTQYPYHVDFTFIHFYSGNETCDATASRDEVGAQNQAFSSKLKEKGNIIELNFYGEELGMNQWNKNRIFYHDDSKIIAQNLFPYTPNCMAYAIVHKSGDYFVHYGSSSIDKSLFHADLFMAIYE